MLYSKEEDMKTSEFKITQIITNMICCFATACAVIPFILLIVASFTDNDWASVHGFTFFPGKLSLEAYQYIVAKWGVIGKAYMMTIIVTLVGTVTCLFISVLFAYGISKRHIPGMKIISFLMIFTMLFNGGVVSTYYCYVRILNIKDSLWALIVPNMLMNAFNVILIRNYFTNSIPASLEEAAHIDGAGEFRILTSVILPLGKPIIATVGLMTALGYWNDWLNGLYYLSARGGSQYYTIQIVLNNISEDIRSIAAAATSSNAMAVSAKLPSTTIRMSIAVVGILPILIIYPFFQRYFVKGITLGGVKE